MTVSNECPAADAAVLRGAVASQPGNGMNQRSHGFELLRALSKEICKTKLNILTDTSGGDPKKNASGYFNIPEYYWEGV